jgi:hypothetical protein
MKSLFIGTLLVLAIPSEASQVASNNRCQALENFATLVMSSRQTGSTYYETQALLPISPDYLRADIDRMINVAYKKPRFIFSEARQLESIMHFSVEQKKNCLKESV